MSESKNTETAAAGIPEGLLDILGKEHTLTILTHLYQEPHSTASEVAGVLGIHIATAQKYLEASEKAGILVSRDRPSKPRTAKEYSLVSPRISIEIDIEALAGAVEGAGGGTPDLGEIMVREKARSDVAYEWDDAGQRITAILFFRKGMRRRMERKVVLSQEEGRFLWNVPFQSESFRSVAEIMKNAGLEGSSFRIMEMVRKFESLEIIIVAQGGV